MIKLQRPPCPNPTALETNYKNPDNKRALRDACHDKCMYCESLISHTYYGDVEHIKPIAKFPNLKFVWENLGYVCAQCNGKKLDKWDDNHPFVDPFSEEPSQTLAPLGAFIYHCGGNERGEYTWREIELNRASLLTKRQDRIDQLRNLIDKVERTENQNIRDAVFTELTDFVGEHNEYSMVAKAALSALQAEHQ